MRREIDCGQRTAHPEHVWKEPRTPPEGARVGVTHTETWWCPGVSPSLPPWYGQVDCAREDELLAQQACPIPHPHEGRACWSPEGERSTLTLRDRGHPTYYVGTAPETIPEGSRYWLDTATGQLTRDRPRPQEPIPPDASAVERWEAELRAFLPYAAPWNRRWEDMSAWEKVLLGNIYLNTGRFWLDRVGPHAHRPHYSRPPGWAEALETEGP